MAAFNLVNSFLKDLGEAQFDFASDTFTVALFAAANAPTNASRLLSGETQIAYTNLSSRALTLVASETFDTFKWRATFSDLVLTASGGDVATFRYGAIYDDTNASDLIVGWWDFGADQTIVDGASLTIDLTDANQTLVSVTRA